MNLSIFQNKKKHIKGKICYYHYTHTNNFFKIYFYKNTDNASKAT